MIPLAVGDLLLTICSPWAQEEDSTGTLFGITEPRRGAPRFSTIAQSLESHGQAVVCGRLWRRRDDALWTA